MNNQKAGAKVDSSHKDKSSYDVIKGVGRALI